MFSWDVYITFVIIGCAFILVIMKAMKIKKPSCTGCEKKCLKASKNVCPK